MRFAPILTGGALAIAAPALAQTGAGQMTPPATSAAAATPTRSSTPSTTAAATTDSTGQTSAPTAAAGATATATPTVVQPAVGATVYGAGGAPVGTIKGMDSEYVTLSTDKGEVRLPRAGVGPGINRPVIGLTAAQLDAAVTRANASRPASTGAAAADAAEPAAPTKRTTTRKPRRRR